MYYFFLCACVCFLPQKSQKSITLTRKPYKLTPLHYVTDTSVNQCIAQRAKCGHIVNVLHVSGSVSGGAVDGSQIQSVLSTLKVMPDDDKIKVVEKVQEVVGSTGIDSLAQYVTSQEHRNTLFGVLQQAATKK